MRAKSTALMLACVFAIWCLLPSCGHTPQNPDDGDIPYIDNEPPSAVVTQPADGATLSGSVIISADATDNIGVNHVEFYLDNAEIPGSSDDTSPYQCTWNTTTAADLSTHSIYVKAFDTSLNFSYSDTIHVTVDNTTGDNTPPTVSITYPLDGDTVSSILTMTADATDNVAVYKVEFFIDGVLPQDGTEYNYPYEHVWDTSALSDGSVHSIFAKATDTSDNYSYSDTIYVTVYNGTADIDFSFSISADMRNFTGDDPDYFRGACEAISSVGPGAFMILPGDLDPPNDAQYTIQTYIASNYVWYPAIGNHEAETPSDMSWLRNYNANGNTLPNIVNVGPPGSVETTYSFDYGDIHFVVLNQYYDGSSDVGTDGDVTDALYNWMVADLDANTKPMVFVVGHEPAYPMPDEDSGRLRHEDDSLNQHGANRDRFWSTLVNYGVIAYICGHTHNYSITNFNGVWQVDCGHARGTGDIGARSTFIMIKIMKDKSVDFDTYRLDFDSMKYVLTHTDQLKGPSAQQAIQYTVTLQ